MQNLQPYMQHFSSMRRHKMFNRNDKFRPYKARISLPAFVSC